MKKRIITPIILLSSLMMVGAVAGCNNNTNTNNTTSSEHVPQHYDGQGAPANGFGLDGDTYTDTNTGKDYQKQNGQWIEVHKSVELSGEGAPDASLGENGDTYVDTISGAEYEKRNGEWVVTKKGDTTYVVTFNLNGGRLANGATEIPSQTIREGRWVVEPTMNPVKENCKFLGWYTDEDVKWAFKGSQVWADLELIAKYSVNEDQKITYTVDPNNGEARYTVETFVGDSSYPKIPSNPGYDFVGWKKQSDGSLYNGVVTANMNGETVIAQWEKAAFGVSYQVEANGEVTITGILNIEATTITVPETVGGRRVTRISSKAFNNRIYLKTVYIPSSVKTIEPGAFRGAWRLESINVDSANTNYTSVDGILFSKSMDVLECAPTKSVTSYTVPKTVTKIQDYAFYESKDMGLSSITFNEGLVEIGQSAFYMNEKISSLTFPKTLRKIGKSAFYGSTYTMEDDTWTSPQGVLQTVQFNDGLEEIGEAAFANQYFKDTFQLPDSVKVLAPYAFVNCTAITKFILPNDLETFAPSAFNGCTGILEFACKEGCKNFAVVDKIIYTKDMTKLVLCPSGRTEAVTVPEGVTQIGDYAFYMVDNLQEYNFPSTVKRFGRETFAQTYGLKSFTIPDSVIEIGIECFMGAESLSKITIGTGLTSIPEAAFYETAISSVTIPGNVKSIGYEAFTGTRLASATLGEGVEEIEHDAFSRTPLANISLPDSLTTIGSGAFRNTSVKTLALGKNVSSVGEEICYNSSTSTTSLETITVDSANPNFTVDNNMFMDKSKETLYFATNKLGNDIVIPEGVKYIGNSAFSNLKTVTSYTFPSTLVEIGEGAFLSTKVKSITFPASLKKIGEGAFFNGVVNTVNFNNGLEEIGGYSFRMAEITAISIPNTVKKIGEYAFYQTGVFGAFTAPLSLGTGVEEIGEGAFMNCVLIDTVNIPASVTSLGVGAFGADISTYGQRLTDITVDSANPNYTAENGVVMNKAKTSVYAYAAGKTTVTLPSTVTRIENYGLSAGGNSIRGVLTTSISLPSSLEYIGKYGLFGQFRVTALTVPASVAYVGESAFGYWSGNQAITFNCTRSYAAEKFDKNFLNSCSAKVTYQGE